MSEQAEAQAKQGPGGLGFIQEVVAEVKRVVWPSWDDTKSAAFTVVIMVVVLGLFLGGVDLVASTSLGWLSDLGLY